MPHVKFSPMTSALVVALALSLTALLSGARAQETTLLSFDANNDNPAVPYSGVIFDKEGNLYGTLMDGGGNYKNCEYGCGAVYELTADGTENLLYQFQGMGNGSSDGALPYASLVRDSKGNLYGTTHVGGTDNFGTVSRSHRRVWKPFCTVSRAGAMAVGQWAACFSMATPCTELRPTMPAAMARYSVSQKAGAH